MTNRQRYPFGRLILTVCVALALSGLTGTVSGCESKKNTPVPETAVTQTKPTESSRESVRETSASETDPGRPVVISEVQEIRVPFGKISENVGYYKLGLTDRDAPSYALKGQYVYCLSGYGGDYALRRINIENLEKSHMWNIRINGGTATLLDFGIRINVNGETVFYDLNLHEIYRARDIGEKLIIVPYQDGYILKQGADLRILHLDEETPYRTLDSKDYVITGYHSTGDNTYLILKEENTQEPDLCTVYDVNRKIYYKRFQDNVTLSDENMVRYAKGKYVVTNYSNKKSSAYAGKNPGKPGSSLFDGTNLYFYDEADHKIKYYVPSKQTICVISEAEFTVGAALKGMYGSYVYAQYANSMYFIDAAGQNEQEGESYIAKIKKDTDELKKNLEFRYRINIVSGKDVIKPASQTAKLEAVTSDLETLTAMNKLSTALKNFNFKFFDEFKWNKKNGISVLLARSIVLPDESGVVSSLSFTGEEDYFIALDIRSLDLATSFCREIMHTIEHRMVNSELIFTDWNNYNPEGFAYSEIIAGSAEAPYVPENETDPANVYFTDSYACASQYEDRARLFTVMFMPESYPKNLSDYPKLMSKAAGLKRILMTYYPSLSDATILDNIG